MQKELVPRDMAWIFQLGLVTVWLWLYLLILVFILQSKSFIWVTSKYLGSCWSYRKTKTTLLYQTTHSASYEPSYRSLRETFVK